MRVNALQTKAFKLFSYLNTHPTFIILVEFTEVFIFHAPTRIEHVTAP